MSIDHRFHVIAIELRGVQLRQALLDLPVALVQLSGPLDARAIRSIGQLLLRFQMVIDHRLRELLDPRVLRFLGGHMSELDLGHVGHRGL
jgi:hypothetical protein